MDDTRCALCKTTLDPAGKCVTCAAAAEGLLRISCLDFVTIRDAMTHLEECGLAPEMEQVPAATPTEARRPSWNLYIPEDQLEEARRVLDKDWAGLVEGEGEAAVEAMRRGRAGVTVEAGAELVCPACGNRFTAGGSEVECPDCGLSLGGPMGEAEEQ